MALTSGETFAGYTVVRRLDSGSTDEVYLLEDPQSTRPVALKFLSPALSNDGAVRSRFMSETAASANLDHPHIIESYARGDYDGRLWVVTDYVEGTTAAQQMNERFPAVAAADDVLPIITALAGALDYAHEHGMLHRDVKPANIVLSNPSQGESRILLTDFGIGSPTGTGGYAAPEIRGTEVDGPDVDGRADQYALAATAFHMLTGAPPGAGPARLSEQRPELAGLEGAFSKALSRRPDDRFDSCSQFADAVNAAAGSSIGERTAAPTPETVSVISYPAYASHDGAADDASHVSAPEPAPARLVYAGAAQAVATKRKPRVLWVALATLVLLAGLLGLGALIGRQKTGNTAASIRATPVTPPASAPVGSPPASGPAAIPTTSPGQPPGQQPNRLDGTYRLNVQRSKQTFNYTPSPEPPDVNTWWAFRTTCTQASCSAIAVQLDDNDHSLAKTPSGRPIIMKFNDGEWRSQRETVQFPCVRDDGAKRTQTQTQVLTLRPEPNGNLVGEMEVRVHSNECGQKAATIRVPSTADRTGDTPAGVYVPDPARAGAGPGEVPEENSPTTTPTSPTTTSPTTTPSR